MTAPAGLTLDIPRRPSRFFAALADADQHLARVERLEWTASFAPRIRAMASCPCGRTMEIRDDRIGLTAEETQAAADAVADMLGRPMDDFTAQLVAQVIDAINGERARADDEFQREFWDDHASCDYGDDR